MNATSELPRGFVGYQVTERLYCGAQTLVYRAIREVDQQSVILKLLQQDYPSMNDLLQFRNQYVITQSLKLPGVVATYGLESYHNSYVLVMEDVGGIALNQYAKGQSLSVVDVLEIAVQLADILHDLYQHRIIHKDIKPANILIHPQTRQVKLIDFSLASLLPQEIQEIKNPGSLEGTLAYLAPEQTGRMNRGIDYRSDFYALGVTLFELLTGKLPFQSNDPMELVHCHIAKQPPDLDAFKIPRTVAAIVFKLMAKNPEDRYQSAWGLKYDLEQCLAQLQTQGAIDDWPLGQRDICDRFIIPEKLYGREPEIATLLAAFDRISGNYHEHSALQWPLLSPSTAPPRNELLLIAGYSGIGKTVIVNEVHKPILQRRGYFIKGKFDQFSRNTPFSAFLQALRDLVGQLLSENDLQLQCWKNRILEAVGDNGQVVVEVLPELEQVIGPQPPLPTLSGGAAQNRFNFIFQRFIRVFAQPDHPLVVFLDDLQWADSASLQLIRLLMAEAHQGYLLLLGAYRENEVFPTHPLMVALGEVDKTGEVRTTLTLKPLSPESVNQLVAETLKCSPALAQPLTQWVYHKTQGNPFFVTQFLKALYQDGLITFDSTQGYWQCDIAAIREAALTDDVVTLIAQRLQKLPPEAQSVLQLAACIGNQFDLTTLAIVSESSESEVAAALWPALQTGLIVPQSEIYKFYGGEMSPVVQTRAVCPSYKFLHDRVQQAAYSLIPPEQTSLTHLKIGQLLLRNTPDLHQGERIFEITTQLNYGMTLLDCVDERLHVAELNLKAGLKAKDATAYRAATHFLSQGMQLLTELNWQTHRQLTQALYEAAAETALLNHDFEQMEKLIQIVLAHTEDLFEKIKVYDLQLQAYHIQGQQLQAIDIGRRILRDLGVHLPESATPKATQQHLEKMLTAIRQNPVTTLLNLPSMTDAKAILAAQMMASIVPSVHQAAPELFPILACEEVALSLAYGTSDFSAPGYADFGIVVSTVLNRWSEGYELGQLALQLVDTLQTKAVQSMTCFKVAAFNICNKAPMQASIDLLQQSYTFGLETGDAVHVVVSASFRLLYTYLQGMVFLADLRQEIIDYKSQFPTSQNFLSWAEILTQSITNLMEACEEPEQLKGEFCDENRLLPALLDENDALALHIFFLNKLILSYLFHRLPMAMSYADQGQAYLAVGTGMPSVPTYYYYDSLIRLATYCNLTPTQQQHLMRQVEANQAMLVGYAESAPMNFQHKYVLVEAERQRVLKDRTGALAQYAVAIASAKTYGHLLDASLANELAAKCYLEGGQISFAAAAMQDAYYGYVRWGATAKAHALVQQYPDLLKPILQANLPTSLNPLETLSTWARHSAYTIFASNTCNNSVSEMFDLASVLQAAQTLSSTIHLHDLITNLTQIILKSSGADTCVLMLPEQDDWQIRARATIEPERVEVQTYPLETSADVPIHLIHYVRRTLEPLVINAGEANIPSVVGDYMRRHQPQSVFCSPILAQGRLVGLIYLENRLTKGVFTHDRLEVIQFLCAQAAISLENARLYDQAQQALATSQASAIALERKSNELEQSLCHLQAAQSELVESEQTLKHHALALLQMSTSEALSQGDLTAVLRTLTEITTRTLQIERTSVWVFDDHRTEIHCIDLFEATPQQHSDGIAIAVADYPSYFAAIASESILVVEDAQTDPKTSEFKDGYLLPLGIVSMLDASFLLDGQVGGVICCEQVGTLRHWKQADQLFLQSVANLITLFIESNRRQTQAQELQLTLSQLQQTQVQLVQNEKMSALGNLVAGVAHEINNPVGFIVGNLVEVQHSLQDVMAHLALYRSQASPDQIDAHADEIDLDYLLADLPKMVESMQVGCDRIKSISTSLRTFSRADQDYQVSFNIHDGIDSTLLLLKHRLKANDDHPTIAVKLDYGDLPEIHCFPGQLNQVFMNILANAIDALEDSNQGRSYAEIEASPNHIQISTTQIDAAHIQIQISDNGVGIADDVMQHIFNHLFTTKGVTRGTGLGLAIAHQIVTEKHGGEIRVESAAGSGTTFTITLPIKG